MKNIRFSRSLFQASSSSSTLKTFLILIFLSVSISAGMFGADDVQNKESQDIKKILKQAKKLQRKGEIAAAEKVLRQAVANFPQNNAAKLDLAYLLFKQKQLFEAYNYAYEVAEQDEKNSYAFAILGAVDVSAGNFEEAKTFLNNSLFLNKKEALAWAGLGMLDFYENKGSASIMKLRSAVYLDNQEPDFIFSLAQVSARSEFYREAAVAYGQYLKVAAKNDQERIDRIRGLIKFLNYLGNKQYIYGLAGEAQTVVPLRLVNDRPVIQLKVEKNGEVLNFVLDTGSGVSVISDNAAQRLNIKVVSNGGVARALGGDGKFDIVYGFLNSVYIGDVKIKNVPIYIREFHNKNEDIDGYIGLSLISKYITTIDYGNKTFSLIKREKPGEQKIEPIADGEAVTIPLRLTTSGFFSGQVKIEGFETALNFIVDTGASISVISKNLAGSQQIQEYLQQKTFRVIGAAGVTENVSSYLLPSITFGKFSRTDLKAVALDLDLINEASGFEQAGILGGNFLKNYKMTFDFAQSKVTFVPNSKK